MRAVPVTVILPIDPFPYEGMPVREDKPFKTLYLLHGGFGSQNDWIYYTNIKTYAEVHNLAVVIPGGNNQFFTDQAGVHEYYAEYAGRELVELTRKMFPLSHRREDTFIAGCSMGGYAALKLGMKYSENFGYAAGISVPSVIDGILRKDERRLPEILGGMKFIEAVFGNTDEFAGSEHDLVWYAGSRAEAGSLLPEIYLSCGKSDMLLEDNRNLCQGLRKSGCRVRYEEADGSHDWKFWNDRIRDVIYSWLPLEPDRTEGTAGFMERKPE